ncbi:MAG: hypothetical protein NZ700_10645 [Gemmataceae bacterium]|nr:hypothetical protein [Gemmataceae bacterium]MDW8264447.1 hypothetical protein [Gemmataceae bacterium]
MQVELRCCRCPCQFHVAAEGLDLANPWSAVGDGETLEDHLWASLPEWGETRCPECGDATHVSQESLGQLSRELLLRW